MTSWSIRWGAAGRAGADGAASIVERGSGKMPTAEPNRRVPQIQPPPQAQPWTEERLRLALQSAEKDGARIDLDGSEVLLGAPLPLQGRVSLRNGTLVAGYGVAQAMVIQGEKTFVELEMVRLRGAGVEVRERATLNMEGGGVSQACGVGMLCEDAASVQLTGVEVAATHGTGISVKTGRDLSKMVLSGVTTSGCFEGLSVECQGPAEAAQVEVEGIDIRNCRGYGIYASVAQEDEGEGNQSVNHTVLSIRGGRTLECAGSGVVSSNAAISLEDLEVVACDSGVESSWNGVVQVKRVRVTACKKSGFRCTDGGKLRVEGPGTEVTACGRTGLWVEGENSEATLGGLMVAGCAGSGVLCILGARLTAEHLHVADCAGQGLWVSGKGSQAAVRGARLRRCGMAGLLCSWSATAEVDGAEVLECFGVALEERDGGLLKHKDVVVGGCQSRSFQGPWTEALMTEAIAAACENEATIDLHGGTVRVRTPLSVGGLKRLTIRNGTLKAVDDMGGKYLLFAYGSGTELQLSSVRLHGKGLQAGNRASIRMTRGAIIGAATNGVFSNRCGTVHLDRVEIHDAAECGVRLSGEGEGSPGNVVIRGCRIMGCKADGVRLGGALACEVTSATVNGCQGVALAAEGPETRLVVREGTFAECREGGVSLKDVGGAQLEGLRVTDIRNAYGVHILGGEEGKASGKVVLRSVTMSDCGKGGLLCETDNVFVDGATVGGCNWDGVTAQGESACLTLRGGSVVNCKSGAAVLVSEGGRAEVEGVHVSQCREGLRVEGAGSKAAVHGGKVAECGHAGVVAADKGRVEGTKGLVVELCGTGVDVSGGAQVDLSDGVVVRGCPGTGVLCTKGGEVTLRRVAVQLCSGSGIPCVQGGAVDADDADIEGCKGHGLWVSHTSSRATVRGGRVSDCAFGGLLCSDGARVTAERLQVSGYGGAGVSERRGGVVTKKDVQVQGCKDVAFAGPWTGPVLWEAAQALGPEGFLEVDLGGEEVAMRMGLCVTGGRVTVRNGTLTAEKGLRGPLVLADGKGTRVTFVDLWLRGGGMELNRASLRMEGGGVERGGITCQGAERVEVERASVTGAWGPGMSIGTVGGATVRDCTVAGCSGEGLQFTAGSVTVEGVKIRECESGIVATGGGRLVVRGGRIDECRQDGVEMQSGAVELHDTAVASCVGAGVRARSGAQAMVRGGRIEGCKEAGVACVGGKAEVEGAAIEGCGDGVVVEGSNASASVRNGRIAKATGHGVRCAKGGKVEADGVAISECKVGGVFGEGEGSAVLVRGGTVSAAEGPGVFSGPGAKVEVEGAAIEDCRTGVHVEGGKPAEGEAAVRNVRLMRCRGSGVLCVGGGVVKVEHCDVDGCGGRGVWVSHDKSVATVRGGRIARCVWGGAACGDKGALTMEGVEVVECVGPGVEQKKGGILAKRDVMLSFCKDEAFSGPWTEALLVESVLAADAKGFEADLGGAEVTLRSTLRVSRGKITLSNGTLVAAEGLEEWMVHAPARGRHVTLEHVWLRGAGVGVQSGAMLKMVSGGVAGAKGDAVHCWKGGKAELRGVVIADCGGVAMRADDQSTSSIVRRGVTVSGCGGGEAEGPVTEGAAGEADGATPAKGKGTKRARADGAGTPQGKRPRVGEERAESE